MKNTISYFAAKLILTILTVTLFSSECYAHKFYVSLTEIKFNFATANMEVSMRIFPDDLDLALFEAYGEKPNIATEIENANADKWAEEYLKNHFSILLDGKTVNLSFLGKEPEADAIWIYFEAPFENTVESIEVQNAILTDKFEDQKNIVQVYYNDLNKGLLFDKSHILRKIKLDQ